MSNQDQLRCALCGNPMQLTNDGIAHHLEADGGVDFNQDADHVALDDNGYGL